jgi:hypothetical protein
MPFIGNQPALSYTSFAKQDFTTSATTSYTLDNPVANENEIALFINFVRQEPTTAYTASGTSLTLTSATSASDDMYCVFLGKAVQTVNPPNGSVGLSQLSATGTKDSTTFLRGDNTFASAGGDNTPAFSARPNAAQSIPNEAYTKVSFQTEDFDTDNAFASDKFTVPSGEAGKYYFEATFLINSAADKQFAGLIYKNGSGIFYSIGKQQSGGNASYSAAATASVILDLAVGDYIEFYIYQDTGSSKNTFDTYTKFQGFKLIG